MRAIIDRFEEDYAVIEIGGEMLTVPRALFKGAQEGDHVEITVLGKPHSEPEAPLPDEIPESESAPAEETETIIIDNPDSPDDPHTLFERLRAKRRQKC